MEHQKSKHEFLHSHPMLEKKHGLDLSNHVIVDKPDWEKAREVPTSPGPYGSLHLGRGSFGDAIRALKDGKQVARSGWNGKGMFLSVAYPNRDGMVNAAVTFNKSFTGANTHLDNFIVMKTAKNSLVAWLASQTDMLSEDWNLV